MISRAAAPSSSSPIANLSARSVRAQGHTLRSFATVQENAPPVHRHGGLKDQDRIFTNLYGHHGTDLKSAMKYGDWYRTKDIVLKGHDWVSRVQSSRPRGDDDKKPLIVLGGEGNVGALEEVTWMLIYFGFAAYFGNQGLGSSWSWWCRFPIRHEIRKWWKKHFFF